MALEKVAEKHCVGVIEAIGMAAAVEAMDTMLKCANVHLIGFEYSGLRGRIVVKVEGNVSDVANALDKAAIATEAIEGTLMGGYESLSIYPAMEDVVYQTMIMNAKTIGTPAQIASGKRPCGYNDYKGREWMKK